MDDFPIELKNCPNPKCIEPDNQKLRKIDGKRLYYVVCGTCGHKGPVVTATPEFAARFAGREWNRRLQNRLPDNERQRLMEGEVIH